MRRICILSGGGVKGLAQIMTLAKKESEVGDLYRYYDLMVGTSVGAINAAAIASGKISATKMYLIYVDMLKKVFKKKFLGFPKYDRKNFCDVWINLGLGSMKMQDCKTKLLITAVDTCADKNHYFKSWTKDDGERNLMGEVCKSFAAPVFFGHIPDPERQMVFTDGGCGTSNLSLEEALVEAVLLDWTKEELQIDVYGCGYVDTKMSYEQASKERTIAQLLDFMKPIDGGLARFQSLEDKISRMKKITEKFKNIHFEYWDIEMEKKHDGLDKMQYINEYIEYGNRMSKAPLIKI
jgi:hypothetical protein